MTNVTETMYPIVRNEKDSGWLVKAHVHTKEFLDADNEGSRQNSYLLAHSHSLKAVSIGKRGAAIERNYTIVNKVNKDGTISQLIRITRPTGGYKFFKAEVKANGVEYDVEKAIHAACYWFIEERIKCQDAILSKNIESVKTRKRERHSFLFGDPTLGLRRLTGK